MKHNVMKALILEDDTLLADLLESLAPEYPREDIDCIEHYRALLRGEED